MRPILGQNAIVENVSGDASTRGVTRAVRAAADGSTLSIGTSTTHMLADGLSARPFDLSADLGPVILIGSEPLLIVVRKSLPIGHPVIPGHSRLRENLEIVARDSQVRNCAQ